MSHWNYRVLRTETEGMPMFTIIEVYYNSIGAPCAWADNASSRLIWDDYDDLKGTVAKIRVAFDKPVLTVGEGDELVPYVPST